MNGSNDTIAVERYDVLGPGYRSTRQPDLRIAAQIELLLGDARTVLNVGAGAGSYESTQREVLAVEPSREMIRQRPPTSAPVVVAHAEALPFPDDSFDACTAFLTVHHWSDQLRGLREMRRVSRKRVLLLTYLPGAVPAEHRWLTAAYFPFIARLDADVFPSRATLEEALGPLAIARVDIPNDCTDGFLDAYWARPEAYLDARVRAGMSGFRLMPEPELSAGLEDLERDLSNGSWDARFGELRKAEAFDAGLRLVSAA